MSEWKKNARLSADVDNVIIRVTLRSRLKMSKSEMLRAFWDFVPSEMSMLQFDETWLFPVYGGSGMPASMMAAVFYRKSPDNPALDGADFGYHGDTYEYDPDLGYRLVNTNLRKILEDKDQVRSYYR